MKSMSKCMMATSSLMDDFLAMLQSLLLAQDFIGSNNIVTTDCPTAKEKNLDNNIIRDANFNIV